MMNIIFLLVQLAGGFIVGKMIEKTIEGITLVPETSLGLLSKAIKRDEGIILITKSALAVLITAIVTILLGIVVGISYEVANIYLPVQLMSFVMTIVLKKAKAMPRVILVGMLIELGFGSIISQEQKRTLKKLTVWLLLDIFFARASWTQVKGVCYYYKETFFIALENAGRNIRKMKSSIRKYNTDICLILFVLACTGVFAICLCVAIAHLIDGVDTTAEITAGFACLILGIAMMLNYARIQDLEQEAK